MSNDEFRAYLMLQIRNLIADKEACIASANMETARGGWTGDWQIPINEADKKIQELMARLEVVS